MAEIGYDEGAYDTEREVKGVKLAGQERPERHEHDKGDNKALNARPGFMGALEDGLELLLFHPPCFGCKSRGRIKEADGLRLGIFQDTEGVIRRMDKQRYFHSINHPRLRRV